MAAEKLRRSCTLLQSFATNALDLHDCLGRRPLERLGQLNLTGRLGRLRRHIGLGAAMRVRQLR